MPDVALGPQLAPTDTVRFLESLRPALNDGLYTVTVTHDLEVVQGTSDFHGERTLDFVVAGPRFVLAPGEVVSCFPPPGASGDFDAVLPHVLLRRASLPWERSSTPEQDRDGPPWLALLVLEEAEILKTDTVSVSALTASVNNAPTALALPFAILPLGPGDDPTETALIIEIDADLAKTLLPIVAELPLLTGVRDVNGTDAKALVVANRLPSPGKRNYVHLVSLEMQYDWGTKEHWAKSLKGSIRFVSLAHWDFFCQPTGGDLAGILKNISAGRPRLDPSGLDTAFGPVQAGAVPVEYRLETGERTAAWYHGPLAERDHGVALDLPVRRAIDLMLLEQATAMRDISYAAAWELGRLLALRDPAVGIPLHQWKRQVAQAGATVEWVKVAPELVPTAPASPVFPIPLRDWFENALSRLAAVPFSYLVPEQGLLPPETIRFFTIDLSWIAALFDGAFSIGRTSERQRTADGKLRDALPSISARSGILLRSAAVAGWPDLVVDGFGAGAEVLDVVRFERLAKDTLLVLFAGALGSVEVHPHPQEMHFGLDGDSAAGFTKNGNKVAFRITLPPTGNARVIDIDALRNSIGANGSPDFALKMLEAAPKASYSVQTVEVPRHV